MGTDPSPPSSPDPSQIALPASPDYSPSQLPATSASDEETRKRLGVDLLYRPQAIQTDDPAYSVPRTLPNFTSLTAAIPPPKLNVHQNPDFALLGFQSQGALRRLVAAFREVDGQNAFVEHQALQQERRKMERQAAWQAGETPTRAFSEPSIFRFESADGGRLRVGTRTVGKLSRSGSSLIEPNRYQLRQFESQCVEEERKISVIQEEMRRAHEEADAQDQESTDRDDEASVAQKEEVGSKRKKKKTKKKKATVTSVPAAGAEREPAVVASTGADKGEVDGMAREEMSEVERMVLQEWEDLAADQGQINLHKALAESEAKEKEALDELLGKREERKVEQKVEKPGVAAEDDTAWMESSPPPKEETVKAKKKSAKKPKAAASSVKDEKSEPPSAPTPSDSKSSLLQSPEVERAPMVKFASSTVFEQLGGSPARTAAGDPSAPAASTVIEPPSQAADETTSGKDKSAGRNRYHAKKESRKALRAEKFKDDLQASPAPSAGLADSQTSSSSKAAASISSRVDAVSQARKAAWKAEKRTKAKLAKSLPPPASMPAVSVPAGRVAPDSTVPPIVDSAETAGFKEEVTPEDDDPTPRPFRPCPLPETEAEPTPTHPTLRLPTIHVQQEASPSGRRPSLPATDICAPLAVIGHGHKPDLPPTPSIITTHPSNTTIPGSESTLSVSIIEAPEPPSPGPTIFTFGSIGPEDIAAASVSSAQEAWYEKIRAANHGRSLTAPARESAPDPGRAIAPPAVRNAARLRNASSPAAIQYEEQPEAQRLPTPPPATPQWLVPSAMITPPMQHANVTQQWETPIPGTPYLPLPFQQIESSSPQTQTPAQGRQERFTPHYPSIQPSVPQEESREPLPDPANFPAAPEISTPEQAGRVVMPSSAPAIVAKRALVAPVRVGPLLGVMESRVYPSIVAGASTTQTPVEEVVVRLPPQVRRPPALQPAPALSELLLPAIPSRPSSRNRRPSIPSSRTSAQSVRAQDPRPEPLHFQEIEREITGPQHPIQHTVPDVLPPKAFMSASSSSDLEIVFHHPWLITEKDPVPKFEKALRAPTPRLLEVSDAAASMEQVVTPSQEREDQQQGELFETVVSAPPADEAATHHELQPEDSDPVEDVLSVTSPRFAIAESQGQNEGSAPGEAIGGPTVTVEVAEGSVCPADGGEPIQNPVSESLEDLEATQSEPQPEGSDPNETVAGDAAVAPESRVEASERIQFTVTSPADAERSQQEENLPADVGLPPFQASPGPWPTPNPGSPASFVDAPPIDPSLASDAPTPEPTSEPAPAVTMLLRRGSLLPIPIMRLAPLPVVPMGRSFSVPSTRVSTPISRLPASNSLPRGIFQPMPDPLPNDGPYPLARSWTLYFSDPNAKATRAPLLKTVGAHYSGSLVPIFTATNLEDLFGWWKALRRMIAASTGRPIEPQGQMMDPRMAGLGIEGFGEEKSFHFFTKGVLPMWEDPMAAKGGKMMFAGKPSEAAQVDALFLEIVHLLVGGQIEEEAPVEDGSDTCVLGATLAKRKLNIRIEIWLGGTEAPPAEWVNKVQAVVERSCPNWRIYPYKSFSTAH